ncbi:MAG: PilZ domain-containing protein [Candidatus Omnitrophota bacterium]
MNAQLDRRLFRRIEGEFAVRYAMQGSDREQYAITRDISGGGMKISVIKKMSPGSDIELVVFKNNSSTASRCRGEIAWVSKKPIKRGQNKVFDVGIRFKESSFLCIGNLINDLKEEIKEKDSVLSIAG